MQFYRSSGGFNPKTENGVGLKGEKGGGIEACWSFRLLDLIFFEICLVYILSYVSIIYIYTYKVGLSVCTFFCPIITQKPLDRYCCESLISPRFKGYRCQSLIIPRFKGCCCESEMPPAMKEIFKLSLI